MSGLEELLPYAIRLGLDIWRIRREGRPDRLRRKMERALAAGQARRAIRYARRLGLETVTQ